MIANILIIEDDIELAESIASFLIHNNFSITICNRPHKIKELISQQNFDLIICDVVMPSISGFELMKQISKIYNGKFIFLTALDKVDHQLEGFSVGACDYFVKPLDPRLLLAKINAHMLPINLKEEPVLDVITLVNLTLSRLHRTAKINEENLNLTSSEFDLLLALVQHHGKFISREWYFENYLFKEYQPYDRTMDGKASKIRNKMRAIDSSWNIVVKWGKGYNLQYEKSI